MLPPSISEAPSATVDAPVNERAHAVARAQVLRVRLQPQIERYRHIAARADALLDAHVFADSDGVLGFVWDLFLGPIEDRAFASARHMSTQEHQVFIDLKTLLDDVERRAGKEGVSTVLRSVDDRYLTTDLELSDAVIGVLRALRRI